MRRREVCTGVDGVQRPPQPLERASAQRIVVRGAIGGFDHGGGSRLELLGVLLILGPEARIGAEEGMLRHVRAVAARGRAASDRLGERADVVRARAAADAEVANAELVGLPAELGDLVAVARERVEGGRERLAVEAALAQRLEAR